MQRAAHTLASAAAAAAAAEATAVRLHDLRAEFRAYAGFAAGYGVKAAAATREALVTAEARQSARRAEAEARRVVTEGQFRHRRAAVDTSARAIERAASGTLNRAEPA